MTTTALTRRMMFAAAAVLLAGPFARAARASEQNGLLVWPEDPVYTFLERLEALGDISYADLETRPLRRSDIAKLLDEVTPDELRPTDREWLLWYRAEFAPPRAGHTISRDGSRLEYTDGNSFASIGPSMQFSAIRYSPSGDLTRWTDFGVEGFGEIGSWFFVHGTAHEITQSGDRLGPPPANSPDQGYSGWTSNDINKAYYFDPSEGYISMAWARGGIWLGRFPESWGPGYRGQIFLSDHAPSMPAVVLMLRPWKWLSYRFVVASLQSGIIDSSTLRVPTPGQTFTRYYGKQLAAQRIDVWPVKRLRIGLNESVVYGDAGFQLQYMNPFVDLLHIQHAAGGLDNAQFGADATLYWPRYTVVYGALFVDELKKSVIFNAEKNRNWIAVQAGLRVADAWGFLPGSMFRFEYTRLNPWVYQHRYPWSTFTNAGVGLTGPAPIQYPLGFWLGQNSDDLYCQIAYDLPRRVTITLDTERTRKGPEASAATQAYDGPNYRATPFLSGNVATTWQTGAGISWSAWRRISLNGRIAYSRTHAADGTSGEWSTNVGIAWAEW